MILEYSKVRHNSRTPERANPSDAGLDVFYGPEEGDEAGQWLQPAESKVFSTGLKFGALGSTDG